MRAIETKHSEFPLTIENMEESGVFTGYASVFDVVDEQKDVILHGAFTRTLAEKKYEVKLLWQHRQDEPIGVFDLIKEDAKGLYVHGRLLLDVQRGREAYSLLKSGALNGLSIGYNAKEYRYDKVRGIRVIKDIDLYEISLVTFPCNRQAVITNVKGEIPKTVREFEEFLRDAGFSRKHAKLVASNGFAEERPLRDAMEAENFCGSVENAMFILTI